jgi:hypothetical protein
MNCRHVQAPGDPVGRWLFISPNVRPEMSSESGHWLRRQPCQIQDPCRKCVETKVIPGHSTVRLICRKPRHEAQVVVSLDENRRVKILAPYFRLFPYLFRAMATDVPGLRRESDGTFPFLSGCFKLTCRGSEREVRIGRVRFGITSVNSV